MSSSSSLPSGHHSGPTLPMLNGYWAVVPQLFPQSFGQMPAAASSPVITPTSNNNRQCRDLQRLFIDNEAEIFPTFNECETLLRIANEHFSQIEKAGKSAKPLRVVKKVTQVAGLPYITHTAYDSQDRLRVYLTLPKEPKSRGNNGNLEMEPGSVHLSDAIGVAFQRAGAPTLTKVQQITAVLFGNGDNTGLMNRVKQHRRRYANDEDVIPNGNDNAHLVIFQNRPSAFQEFDVTRRFAFAQNDIPFVLYATLTSLQALHVSGNVCNNLTLANLAFKKISNGRYNEYEVSIKPNPPLDSNTPDKARLDAWRYFSPERLAYVEDPVSNPEPNRVLEDIWHLGIIFYYLQTGAYPFRCELMSHLFQLKQAMQKFGKMTDLQSLIRPSQTSNVSRAAAAPRVPPSDEPPYTQIPVLPAGSASSAGLLSAQKLGLQAEIDRAITFLQQCVFTAEQKVAFVNAKNSQIISEFDELKLSLIRKKAFLSAITNEDYKAIVSLKALEVLLAPCRESADGKHPEIEAFKRRKLFIESEINQLKGIVDSQLYAKINYCSVVPKYDKDLTAICNLIKRIATFEESDLMQMCREGTFDSIVSIRRLEQTLSQFLVYRPHFESSRGVPDKEHESSSDGLSSSHTNLAASMTLPSLPVLEQGEEAAASAHDIGPCSTPGQVKPQEDSAVSAPDPNDQSSPVFDEHESAAARTYLGSNAAEHGSLRRKQSDPAMPYEARNALNEVPQSMFKSSTNLAMRSTSQPSDDDSSSGQNTSVSGLNMSSVNTTRTTGNRFIETSESQFDGRQLDSVTECMIQSYPEDRMSLAEAATILEVLTMQQQQLLENHEGSPPGTPTQQKTPDGSPVKAKQTGVGTSPVRNRATPLRRTISSPSRQFPIDETRTHS